MYLNRVIYLNIIFNFELKNYSIKILLLKLIQNLN